MFFVEERVLWLGGDDVATYGLSVDPGGHARFLRCTNLLGLLQCEARGGVVLGFPVLHRVVKR